MNRKNLTAAVLAGLAGVAGIAGAAQAAVNMNPDGLGEVLLYPYYTTNDDNTTLVHATVENDNMHHFREKYWVLLQDEPTNVEAEGFVSNARLAVIPIDRNDAVQPAVMVEGSVLTLNGQSLSDGARTPTAQSVFTIEE